MTNEALQIIKMLREARLGWIADELVESIALGRQTTKAYREPGAKRSIKATAVEPFSEQEEMALIVETLAQYFLVMPRAWSIARARFAKPDTFKKVNLEQKKLAPGDSGNEREQSYSVALGIAGDGETTFHDFSPEFRNRTQPSLRRVLSALWPHGPEDFHERFDQEESKQ